MNEQLEPRLGTGTDVQAKVEQWKPSRSECLRDYQVGIKFLSIGCIISVGCKEIPFTTVKEGMKALNDYVANPYETRTVWQERFAKEEEL
jgi:hypothetical protein